MVRDTGVGMVTLLVILACAMLGGLWVPLVALALTFKRSA